MRVTVNVDGRRAGVNISVLVETEADGDVRFTVPTVSRAPQVSFTVDFDDLEEALAHLSAHRQLDAPAPSIDDSTKP